MYIRKDFNLSDFEIKAIDGESNEMIIEGYASTYGNMDKVDDIIEKGAFGKLSANKIKFLYQHDVRKPIGVIKVVSDDEKGVFIQAKFSDTALARDAYTLAKDGALDKFSIGFMIPANGYSYDEKKGVRIISKANLMEVSLVTFPANDKASVTSVKGLGENGFKTKRELEDSLRFMGFSQNESLIITSKAYPALEEHWDSGVVKDNQSESEYKDVLSALDNFNKKIKEMSNDN